MDPDFKKDHDEFKSLIELSDTTPHFANPKTQERFKKHIEECPECAGLFKELKKREKKVLSEHEEYLRQEALKPPMELIQVGYWNNEELEINDFINPMKISPKPYPNKKEISSYLKAGITIAYSLGFSYCRFHCGIEDSELGCRELSDGKYTWPEGYFHYIEEHNVPIPDDFLEHIKSENYKIKEFDPSVFNISSKMEPWKN